MPTPKSIQSTVIPVLRYDDAPAAIDWLCAALGFEKRLVVPGENGTVLHAQLTYHHGMIMLGTTRPEERSLGEAKGPGICLIVEDADANLAVAAAHGATIVRDIEDMPFGGRAFTCADPEGNLWHIGTYDPWEEVPPVSSTVV